MLGLGGEEVVWFGLLWLPCLLLTLGCTRQEGHLRKRARHSSVFNLYEALDGSLLESFAADPAPAEVEAAGIRLPARVKERTLRGEISTTFTKWRSVVHDAARERWARSALELGVPLPVEALTIDRTTACWLPVYAAVLVQRGARRVVVVDGGDGAVDHHLAGVLTENLGYLAGAGRGGGLTDRACRRVARLPRRGPSVAVGRFPHIAPLAVHRPGM